MSLWEAGSRRYLHWYFEQAHAYSSLFCSLLYHLSVFVAVSCLIWLTISYGDSVGDLMGLLECYL